MLNGKHLYLVLEMFSVFMNMAEDCACAVDMSRLKSANLASVSLGQSGIYLGKVSLPQA